MFCCFKKRQYLCIAIEKDNGSIAQLNRAFDYGSKGYRFESYRSHSEAIEDNQMIALYFLSTSSRHFPIIHSIMGNNQQMK